MIIEQEVEVEARILVESVDGRADGELDPSV